MVNFMYSAYYSIANHDDMLPNCHSSKIWMVKSGPRYHHVEKQILVGYNFKKKKKSSIHK